jgi:hypothetical protein
MVISDSNAKYGPSHETRVTRHPRHIPNILIVDDDVDSAISVESTFRKYGCNIDLARDPKEAR